MKKLYFIFGLLITLVFIFPSCKKDGNGSIRYTMKVDGFESRFTWDSCVAHISGLTFSASLKNDQVNQNFSGEAEKINILSPSETSFTTGNLSTGKYKEAKIILECKQSALKTPFVLFGKFNHGPGAAIPIQIYLNSTMQVVANGNDFSLDSDETKDATLSLNLQTLMSAVTDAELNDAEYNGKIIISLDPNQDLHDKLVNQLSTATSVSF